MASFASEGGGPAVVLPEQVEVLAHRVSTGFCFPFSLQVLALEKDSRKEISFAFQTVAEI